MTPEEKAKRIAAMEDVFTEDPFAPLDPAELVPVELPPSAHPWRKPGRGARRAQRAQTPPHNWDEAEQQAKAYDAAGFPSFLEACVASGMLEAVCDNCGRPWLTRVGVRQGMWPLRAGVPPWQAVPARCPVCEGQPEGWKPSDAGDWVTFWRRQLVGVLRERGRPLLELMKPGQWVPDIQLHRVEAVPPIGGEITRWHIESLGMVQNEPTWPPATFAKGCRLIAWMPVGLKVCATLIPTLQPDPKRREMYAVPFLPIDR
jgi:hypothetical protein